MRQVPPPPAPVHTQSNNRSPLSTSQNPPDKPRSNSDSYATHASAIEITTGIATAKKDTFAAQPETPPSILRLLLCIPTAGAAGGGRAGPGRAVPARSPAHRSGARERGREGEKEGRREGRRDCPPGLRRAPPAGSRRVRDQPPPPQAEPVPRDDRCEGLSCSVSHQPSQLLCSGSFCLLSGEERGSLRFFMRSFDRTGVISLKPFSTQQCR